MERYLEGRDLEAMRREYHELAERARQGLSDIDEEAQSRAR